MKEFDELVRLRHSVRNYNDELLDETVVTAVKDILKLSEKVPFGSKVRFELVDVSKSDYSHLRQLGTYGVIKNARWYIAGVLKYPVENHKNCMLDYGWGFEKSVLSLTDMNLGTCFLGGTLSRKTFGELVRIADDEVIPCVSPLGFSDEKPHLKEKMLRVFASSAKRKAVKDLVFQDNDTRLIKSELADVLELVRWAPSASNKQPWRFRIAGNRVEFYLKRNPLYKKILAMTGAGDLQLIDMGIAMYHFQKGYAQRGIEIKWDDKQILSPPSGVEFIKGCHI
ncbi:MAG: nitroreductase family protein [Deltaproteobacteria bacterium]|nr:nitroreductase family protein [Deltaproteobacteria bacterium]